MDKIGHYSIVGELGRGAMGVVLHGQDTVIGRPVAIKVINVQGDLFGDEAAANQARGSLFNEARSAGRLSHPSIVTIYHVGQEQDFSYIVMEFVDGSSLQSLLQARDTLGRDEIAAIVAETADALDYAHSMSVVHRDVKPANIMLNRRGQVKVCDFGIAKIYTETATTTGMLKGTPHYMSPEQIQGGKADGRSDQYALAVLAYEMITGQRPFVADSIHTLLFRIISAPAVPAHLLNPSVPQAVSAVLEKGMAKQPALRYPTCREFAEALSAAWKPLQKPAEKVISPPELPDLAPQPAKPRVRSARLLIGVTVIAVVSITGGFLYRTSHRGERPAAEPAAEVKAAVPAQRPPQAPPVVSRVDAPPDEAPLKVETPPANRAAPKVEVPAVDRAAPERLAWESVRRSDKPEEYRRYLRDFPAGPNADAARRAVAELEDWAGVAASPNPEALNRFLSAHPGSRFTGAAESMLRRFTQETNDWKSIQSGNRIEAYRDYAARYPAGLHAAEANRRIRELERWAAVRTSSNPEDFRQYARDFPDSAAALDAAQRASELDAARKAQIPPAPQRPPATSPATSAPQPAVVQAPVPAPPDPAAGKAAARAASAEAQKYLQAGRLEQAVAAYGKAASLDPAFWEAHAEQGKAYLKLGNFRAAVESFNRAISLRSTDANLLNSRGYAYYNLTQHSNAIVDFSEAIRLKPDFSEAFLNRGNSKWALGDRAAAEADFKMARTLRGRR